MGLGGGGTGSRRNANPTPPGETCGSSQSQFPGPRSEPEGPGPGPVATSPGQLSLQDTLGRGRPSPLAGPGPCGPPCPPLPVPTPRAAALVLLGVWALPMSPTRQSLTPSRARPTCPQRRVSFCVPPGPVLQGAHHPGLVVCLSLDTTGMSVRRVRYGVGFPRVHAPRWLILLLVSVHSGLPCGCLRGYTHLFLGRHH